MQRRARSMGRAFIPVPDNEAKGFEKENVEKVLNLNTKEYQLSVIVPFGYRIKEQSRQIRESLEDIVEFIN